MRGERRKEKEQGSKEMVLVGPLPGACSSHLSNPAGRSRHTRSSQQPAQQIRKDFVSYRLCSRCGRGRQRRQDEMPEGIHNIARDCLCCLFKEGGPFGEFEGNEPFFGRRLLPGFAVSWNWG